MSRRLGLAAAFLLFTPFTFAADVDVDDLKPGLVTVYRDAQKREVVRLEPTVALNLKANESAHPRLSPDGTVRWEGYLNVLRTGNYRFRVNLRGQFRLLIDGKEVFTAEVKDAAGMKESGDVKVEAGARAVAAEFTRIEGTARVELLWQGPSLRLEPLPFDAVGHLPNKLPARLEADDLAERGRLIAEKHNCTSCHLPANGDGMAKGLRVRQGPDLSELGGRTFPGWVLRWLESPHELRPGTNMPRLFEEGAAGQVERHAVAAYLASLGTPRKSTTPEPSTQQKKESAERGKTLFVSTGCVACHIPPGAKGQAKGDTRKPIPGLGSKTRPLDLAAFLVNPLATHPSGLMPNLLLSQAEASDLAYYLCESKMEELVKPELPAAPAAGEVLKAFKAVESDATKITAFEKLPAADQVRQLGEKLTTARGCANCHTIAPGGKALAKAPARLSFDDVKKSAKGDIGCLSPAKEKRGGAPLFEFSDDDRKALRAFLAEGVTGAGSSAPTYLARTSLTWFGCMNCHQRDGQGGLPSDLVEELRKYEKAENAESVSPPPLTGVGHKLRTSWLREVLVKAGRARPWMGLRMPQFGEANVGRLPEALSALEGAEPDDTIHKVAAGVEKIEGGKFLAGRSGFGCIGCHDIAGIPNKGTRGPDLALMNQRVRYEWYLRWLEQPQKMQPGTKMPTIFLDGKTLLDTVLGGKPDAQAEAMWAYFSLGPSLPLPEGLEPPPSVMLTVQNRPYLLRTFMPDAGSRAIAVGYPGGISIAFDANACRLAYSWSGKFLNAAPVWNDRGGNPAQVLGTRFFTSPAGHPWALGTGNEPPDFAARAKDPAYGAVVPETKIYEGPKYVHFDGYGLDMDGRPIFRYRLDGADGKLSVREQPLPLKSSAGEGLGRQFTLDMPAKRRVWLQVGEASKAPRLLNAADGAQVLEARDASDSGVDGKLLVLPQGDKSLVVNLATVPKDARWVFRPQAGKWQVLLALPEAAEAGQVAVQLNVWAPLRDEAALVKELGSGK